MPMAQGLVNSVATVSYMRKPLRDRADEAVEALKRERRRYSLSEFIEEAVEEKLQRLHPTEPPRRARR